MTESIRINAGKGYDVKIGPGILKEAGAMSAGVLKGRKAAFFSDSRTDRLYGEAAEESFRKAGFETCRFTFPAGEHSKNIGTAAAFIDFMSEHHLSRKDAAVALGGGVAGDMCGFAASVYLRGIDFVQIPTTLLAAVDSSVGGKTGVNIAAGKNLMGTFWQPSLVICDTDTFKTLNNDLILDGTAEIIKTGAIRDESILELIERNGISSGLADIVSRCVKIKGEVVEADEKEGGLRKILNFGHTMAHAIEKDSNYRVSHGKAVAVGMLMVTAASEAAGMTESGTYERLRRLIAAQGFETSYEGSGTGEFCRLAASDKKASGGSISLVYIERAGKASVCDMKLNSLESFLKGGEEIAEAAERSGDR